MGNIDCNPYSVLDLLEELLIEYEGGSGEKPKLLNGKGLKGRLADVSSKIAHNKIGKDYLYSNLFSSAKKALKNSESSISLSKRHLYLALRGIGVEDWEKFDNDENRKRQDWSPLIPLALIPDQSDLENLASYTEENIHGPKGDANTVTHCIEILQKGDGPEFPVEIKFPSNQTFESTLRIHIHDEERALLNWYFDHYISEPFDGPRAQKATNLIRKLGLQMYQQIFQPKNGKNLAEYASNFFANNFMEDVTIKVIGAAPFLNMYWETMQRDASLDPMAIEGVQFVRESQLSKKPVSLKTRPSAELNILIVTSRPAGKWDAEYRTIQRPLVEMINETNLPVNIDIVRPGTYEATLKHLREKRQGFYHIIHFDLHGIVLTYDELIKAQKEQFQSFINRPGRRLNFMQDYGVPDIEPYEGAKSFLIFESTKKNDAPVSVEIAQIAREVNNYSIPICIFNSCHSAKTYGETGDSNAAYVLSKVGAVLVIAMRHSISTSGAKTFFHSLYTHLLEGRTIEKSITNSRRELFYNRERMGHGRQNIDLHDWLIPQVYQMNSVQLNFTRKSGSKEELLPPDFKFGFVGRDIEILQIERILTQKQFLTITGMRGTGKTALLSYLRWWWKLSDFAHEVIYIDLHQPKVKFEGYFIKHLYNKLVDKSRTSIPPGEIENAIRQIIVKLRDQKTIIILDNNSLKPLQVTYGRSEPLDIINFLRILPTQTKFIYASVNRAEPWLKESSFSENVIEIEGFQYDLILEFISAILDYKNVSLHKLMEEDPLSMKRILDISMGIPAYLITLLPKLKSTRPNELLEQINLGTINLS